MKFRQSWSPSLKGALPETRRLLVPRQRLLALDAGLPILVIEGPSGYGKTVLAEMWLALHRGDATCCWISLDASSGDPIIFLNGVLEAVGADVVGKEEAGIDGEAGLSERFAHLCTHLANADTRFVIVFDDVHAIADRHACVYLERLLTLASSKLCLCLTMQPFDVGLGLGRLTAEGKVTWVQAPSLAMTREEVSELSQLRGRPLNDAQLDWLYQVTQGWPALTQIALAAPIDLGDEALARDVTAGSAPLREYIYQRFIQTLSEDDRDVLWTLSCVGSAPVSLLIALNPPASKVDIAILNFRALGLVQNRDLDDSTTVSLHALIREVAARLLADAAARTKTEVLREAAEWKWTHGRGAIAVGLALDGGPELAALARGWIKELGFNFLFRTGQHQTLLGLIERWEKVTRIFDPEIDSIAAWALIFQRQFAQAESRLARISQAGEGALADALHLQRTVIAALRDDFSLAGILSQQWLRNNSGKESFALGIASTVLAFSLKFTADFDRAQVAVRDAMYGFNSVQSAYGTVWAHVVNALVLIQAGRYRAALAQIEAGLTRCPGSQGFGNLRTLLRAQEAFLRYERNELEKVREILGEVLSLLSDQGVVDAVCLGYAAAARARAANGDFGTALDILSEGELIAVQRDFPRLNAALRIERALLLVRSGASSQAKPILQSIPSAYRMKTTARLLQVRIAIADGEGNTARQIAQELLPRLRAQGRQSRLCEALILFALSEDLCGNDRGSLAALGEALEIASVEGYLRTFVDEGKVVMAMIRRWLSDARGGFRPAIVLAKQLLELIDSPEDPALKDTPTTVFNKRERQILALLSDGLSNAQLAQRCFISEGTVKWYLHNLYEKLGVGNRTALLRAVRDLGLKL
ncbi:MAG: winged helix-turn-helix transcriptional regulator [Nevskiaceae bacterium]|nr:MAG: winged helix-turn-helix transcriptional regulator [Nevskiaceae bacterium]